MREKEREKAREHAALLASSVILIVIDMLNTWTIENYGMINCVRSCLFFVCACASRACKS